MQEAELQSLIEKAKQGDNAAFGALYDHFAQRIFRFIRLKIQHVQEAEDLLQDVFLKANKGLKGLRTGDVNFSAWLYKIAANAINDKFRQKYRTPELLQIDENFDVPSGYSLEAEIVHRSDMEEINKAISQLPAPQKQILELRLIQQFSLSEIAGILGKSNLSVRLQQFRAIKKIKAILNNLDEQASQKK